MTTQIAVRLDDDLVAYLDQLIVSGQAKSRAAVVTRALQRERLRSLAEADIAIMGKWHGPDDLDGLDDWLANRSIPEID